MAWRFVSVLLLALLPAALSQSPLRTVFDENAARSAECQSPADTGRCRALLGRFHWNVELQKCLPFNFGGCGGNANNFETSEACEVTCRPVVTTLTTPPAKAESTTQHVPVTTKRQTAWKSRKWKSCYPRKSGAECGPKSGHQKRRRVCIFVDTNERTKPTNCVGDQILLRSCVFKKCPIDGGFSDWGNWSVCTATCGKAKQIRQRTCDNPRPQHGGRPCIGHSSQKRKCKVPSCLGTQLKTLCALRPCLNGGTCSSEGRGFQCLCPKTHSGPICQFLRV